MHQASLFMGMCTETTEENLKKVGNRRHDSGYPPVVLGLGEPAHAKKVWLCRTCLVVQTLWPELCGFDP